MTQKKVDFSNLQEPMFNAFRVVYVAVILRAFVYADPQGRLPDLKTRKQALDQTAVYLNFHTADLDAAIEGTKDMSYRVGEKLGRIREVVLGLPTSVPGLFSLLAFLDSRLLQGDSRRIFVGDEISVDAKELFRHFRNLFLIGEIDHVLLSYLNLINEDVFGFLQGIAQDHGLGEEISIQSGGEDGTTGDLNLQIVASLLSPGQIGLLRNFHAERLSGAVKFDAGVILLSMLTKTGNFGQSTLRQLVTGSDEDRRTVLSQIIEDYK